MKTANKKSMPKASLGAIIKGVAKGVKTVGKGAKKLNDMRPMVKGSKNPYRKKGDLTKIALEGATIATLYGAGAAALLSKSKKSKKPVAKQVIDRAKKASKKK